MEDMSSLVQRFVLHFGEMGGRWGINRTVGQIYALLFVSQKPLNADDLVEKLLISRSNVSMGLKELEAWRLVKRSHVQGDRREYYSAPEEVWGIFQTLAEERQRREVEPTLSMLRDAILEPAAHAQDAHAQKRMREMHDLIELLTKWFADIRKLSPATLERLMHMGGAVARVLELKSQLFGEGKANKSLGNLPARLDMNTEK
jgi:DNA-binding transcriptional regulator GbsR (MarR family)